MNEPSSPAPRCCETSDQGCNPSVDPPSQTKQQAGIKPLFLVPVDFSTESQLAVAYAMALADASHGQIQLLHVNSQRQSPEIIAMWFAHLFDTLELAQPLPYTVKEGAIQDAIPAAAAACNASYVIVTSKAVRDPERFKQSTVLQILRHGAVPYIALQRAPDREQVRSVVFPMDYTDENRMALPHLANLHNQFAPTFHLVTSRVNEPELFERVEEHLENTTELLDSLGASYLVHEIESLEEYTGALLEYSESVEADLLILVSSIDPRAEKLYMLEPHDRALLQQAEGAAVLIINPQRPC